MFPPTGAGAPDEDELFEQGVMESNCVYSLLEDRLVPHEQAWASIPSTALLDSSEVSASVNIHFLDTFIYIYLSYFLGKKNTFSSIFYCTVHYTFT